MGQVVGLDPTGSQMKRWFCCNGVTVTFARSAASKLAVVQIHKCFPIPMRNRNDLYCSLIIFGPRPPLACFGPR